MTPRTEIEATPDDTARRAMFAVLVVGGIFASGAGAVHGLQAAASVALGAALGAANLWTVSRVVGAFLSGAARLPWAAVVLVKLVLLAGALYVIVRSDWILLFPFAIGWGALPVGIVITGGVPSAPVEQKG
ncbi:MAG TPA: hypothetical protein PKD61_01250 [Polyangiaceae bacterium]|nr:hypothetical protein [Polyangiaceae bacterium]